MINRFTGISNLTQDPQSKNIANGNFVVTFSIAINDKDTVTYIDAEVWGKKSRILTTQTKRQTCFYRWKIKIQFLKTRDNQTRSRIYCLVDNIRVLNYEIGPQTEPVAKLKKDSKPKKEETFIEEDEDLYSSMEDIPF